MVKTIRIHNAKNNDQQIEHEAQNIKSVLYQALLKLSGPGNVVRGKR